MKNIGSLAATALVIAALGALPGEAGPGRGHGNGPHAQIAGCPPGLAKKNPPCVPPGLARNQGVRYGTRVGEVLRVGDYIVIRDPRRYDLDVRPGWDYYRDGDRVYRVDSGTRRVLAILELIDAFTN